MTIPSTLQERTGIVFATLAIIYCVLKIVVLWIDVNRQARRAWESEERARDLQGWQETADTGNEKIKAKGNWAKTWQRMRHKKTGKTGIYVEHINIGEGYCMQPDDKSGIIADKYENFEPIESEKEKP